MGDFRTFDGLNLHYDVSGTGPPVVLVHSFGFDGELWSEMGVVAALEQAGRMVVTADARGHGRSGCPHVASAYGADSMARDIVALIDHLGVEWVDLASFSMGSFVALRLLQVEQRVRRAVLGGVGASALSEQTIDPGVFPSDPDHEEAASLIRLYVPYLAGRVDRGAADPRALIEVLRAGFRPTVKDFSAVTAAVLLLCGTRDDDPGPLADAVPGSVVRRVEADHAGTVDHPDFTPSIVTFLGDGILPA